GARGGDATRRPAAFADLLHAEIDETAANDAIDAHEHRHRHDDAVPRAAADRLAGAVNDDPPFGRAFRFGSLAPEKPHHRTVPPVTTESVPASAMPPSGCEDVSSMSSGLTGRSSISAIWRGSTGTSCSSDW